MIYDREKIFELGKSFDSGLIRFESLTDQDKFALSRYYALRNEEIEHQIQSTSSELNAINNNLDAVYSSIKLM